MTRISPSDKIQLAEENLKRVASWITHSDQKVGISLLIQGGLLGFLTTTRAEDIKKIISQPFDLLHFVLYLLLILFIFFILKGGFYSYKALFPDVQSRESSLFFFGSIAGMGLTQFKREFSQLTEDAVEDQLNNQTFITSQIALSKFQNVKAVISNTCLAGISWISILAIIAFIK